MPIRASPARLELELAEEVQRADGPLVGGRLGLGEVLVPLLERLLDLLQHRLLGVALLGGEGLIDHNLRQRLSHVQRVTGGHDVVEVDELHEGLDAHALLLLLLAHGLGHLPRRAVNADYEGVPELAVLVALIVGLHDDGLAAGEAPLQQDDDLAALAAGHKTDATTQ